MIKKLLYLWYDIFVGDKPEITSHVYRNHGIRVQLVISFRATKGKYCYTQAPLIMVSVEDISEATDEILHAKCVYSFPE